MPTQTITVTITTPTDVTIQTMMDRLCVYWGYQATIDGAPNPESKAAFCKRMVAKFVSDSYTSACAGEGTKQGYQEGKTEGERVTVD